MAASGPGKGGIGAAQARIGAVGGRGLRHYVNSVSRRFAFEIDGEALKLLAPYPEGCDGRLERARVLIKRVGTQRQIRPAAGAKRLFSWSGAEGVC